MTTISTNGVHHATDEAIDGLYSFWPGLTPPPAPCPEARFSATLRGKLGGVETLLTVRGMTSEEFRKNLRSIAGLLDPLPVPVSPQPKGEGKDWCTKHQVAMTQTTKDGRSWYSHRQDGQWCKGR